jgi:hypothetical protein
LTDPIPLSSLEEIEQMERQRQQSIESLEISDSLVKCQKCGNTVPLLGTPAKSSSIRIDTLETRINWIENRYSRGLIAKAGAEANIKELKTELAEVLQEEAKADALRRLPLYSNKISKYRFFCSNCFEKVYRRIKKG